MATPSDVDLCRAWREGDTDAGNTLVERHFGSVYRFFCGKLPDQADELTQRTFLAVMEARDRFRDGTSFRAYLFGIARNQLLRHFEKRGKSVDAEVLSRMSVMDLAPSPSRVLAADERRSMVLAALRRLPVDLQIVVELVYWEQMPHKDVADVVGVAPGTIKSRLFRAREQLAEDLARSAPQGSAIDIEAQTAALAELLSPRTES